MHALCLVHLPTYLFIYTLDVLIDNPDICETCNFDMLIYCNAVFPRIGTWGDYFKFQVFLVKSMIEQELYFLERKLEKWHLLLLHTFILTAF